MPTSPVHQGCAASQAIDLDAVVLLLRQVLVASAAPSESPVPRMSTRTRGVAVAGEVGMHGLVARGRAVALAVGDVLEDAPAPGSASASSGSQMRAASRVPSASGIQRSRSRGWRAGTR